MLGAPAALPGKQHLLSQAAPPLPRCSALGQLGAKLAALEQRLQERIRRHPADDSVAMYPMLACACLYTTGRIAIATGCRGRDAEQLLPSAALLLGTGRANLRRLAAIDNAAEAGLHLMAVYMLLNVAIEDDGAWARAGALFAPHAATEWLAAVTQALLADAWQDGVGKTLGRDGWCALHAFFAP